MAKERFLFIDILKGISILLVAYGHIIPGAIPSFTEYAGIFRMPLFFFVSGVLFSNERYKNNFKDFIYKRYKGLVIPYLYFSAIVLFGYMLLNKDYSSFLLHTLLYGWGGYALWFIPVLLCSQIIYYPLCKIQSAKIRLLCVAMLGCISYFSSLVLGYIPYNLLLSFCGAYFFGLGNLSKDTLKYIKKISFWRALLLFSMGLLFSLIFLFSKQQPEWFINNIPSVVFYIAPLGSILSLAMVAWLIEKYCRKIVQDFFSICGKQSYIILAFHQIICMIAQQYVSSKVAILIMIVSLAFLVWFIPAYMPWMLGKKKSV